MKNFIIINISKYFSYIVVITCLFLYAGTGYTQNINDDTLNVFESPNDSLDLMSPYFDYTDSTGIYFFTSSDTVPNPMLTLSYDTLVQANGGAWSNELLFLYEKDFDPSIMEDSIRIVLQDTLGHYFHIPFPGIPSSGFGWRWRRYHYGVDINAHYYDTVRCAFDGVVRIAKYGWGYGNCVVVRHQNGLETLYGHNSVLKVVANQEVKAGDVLALAGCTGWCYGPHVHFEIRYLGIAIDPASLVDFANQKLWKDTIYLSKKDFQYLTKMKVTATIANSTNAYTGTGTVSYYTIKSGDTLSKIARYYGTTVNAICLLNGIKSTSILTIGKTIRVK
jgi:hypothetical protein